MGQAAVPLTQHAFHARALDPTKHTGTGEAPHVHPTSQVSADARQAFDARLVIFVVAGQIFLWHGRGHLSANAVSADESMQGVHPPVHQDRQQGLVFRVGGVVELVCARLRGERESKREREGQ